MESIISSLTSSPIFIIILAILVIIIVIAIIKRLLKLLIPVFILVVLYVGYLYFTGQKIPTTKEEILQHGKETIEKIKDKGEEILKENYKKNRNN
ncbi:MAG: hypothetical protein ISS41_11535 [Candidatus Aminicenantes bacterium]|nr:hypothetical protein [Candidatus Aminicenantes bacterium]MBL7084242.1 hypothetical protein [Candidatus Aminicenantes bacterium]